MHEAQTHEDNSFLTLTYDPDHLPSDCGLDRSHVPGFLKRLRQSIAPAQVRYFQCGEYGATGSRPHYHIALFGYGFPDRTRWATRGAHTTYRSAQLEQLWPFGHAEIGTLTFKSAAYIASYVTKKVKLSEHSTDRARLAFEAKYQRLDPFTGELFLVDQEHATMSLKPGLGEPWFRRYWRDVYPSDQVIMNGKAMKPPRYYDRLLERIEPDLLERVKKTRNANRDVSDLHPDRLRVQEVVKTAQLGTHSKRNL